MKDKIAIFSSGVVYMAEKEEVVAVEVEPGVHVVGTRKVVGIIHEESQPRQPA